MSKIKKIQKNINLMNTNISPAQGEIVYSNNSFSTNVSGQLTQILNSAGAANNNTNVQVFYSNGTWTKPASGNWTRIICIGGGGGGGDGATTASNQRCAGAGGAGGGYTVVDMPTSSLNSTESVIVGAGGSAGIYTGAALVRAGSGGDSSFSNGKKIVKASGGQGGLGGVNSTVNWSPPANSGIGLYDGGIGGSCGSIYANQVGGTYGTFAPGATSYLSAGGGAASRGQSSFSGTPEAFGGNAGTAIGQYNGGILTDTAPAHGTGAPVGFPRGGAGGSTTPLAVTATGGSGGLYGGGGGGAGYRYLNGGAGAQGIVYVITW